MANRQRRARLGPSLRRFEYDGSEGPATDFDLIAPEEHQIFPAIGLNLSPKWEVNFGGIGVTCSSDHLIA